MVSNLRQRLNLVATRNYPISEIGRDAIEFFLNNKLGIKDNKIHLPSVQAWNTMLWTGTVGLCELDEILTTLDALRRFTKKYMEYDLNEGREKSNHFNEEERPNYVEVR